MDSRAFLGLEATHNPFRWLLPVERHLCTSGAFLFGGCGLAAAIGALEGTSGRSLVWATGQYLSFAKPGEVLDIDVTIAVEGHQITQARAGGRAGNREIIPVNAALGERPGWPRGQFETAPAVEPPADVREHVHRRSGDGWINDQLEQRLVKGRGVDDRDGTLGNRQALMGARIPDVIEGIAAPSLAILGDFVPMGIGMSLGIEGGGTSLDNTLRVVSLAPTEWVLLDIRTQGVDRGFGHGLVHMFSENGTLLATASQSCVVRLWR